MPIANIRDLLRIDARDRPLSEIFWTALSERRGGLELDGAAKGRDRSFGHEPALVARCCSPAKLLGFPKLVGPPRCNDAWRCHQCDWHSQGGRAAMASCRTGEQRRPVSSRVNRASARARCVGATRYFASYRPRLRRTSARACSHVALSPGGYWSWRTQHLNLDAASVLRLLKEPP